MTFLTHHLSDIISYAVRGHLNDDDDDDDDGGGGGGGSGGHC